MSFLYASRDCSYERYVKLARNTIRLLHGTRAVVAHYLGSTSSYISPAIVWRGVMRRAMDIRDAALTCQEEQYQLITSSRVVQVVASVSRPQQLLPLNPSAPSPTLTCDRKFPHHRIMGQMVSKMGPKPHASDQRIVLYSSSNPRPVLRSTLR